MRTDYKCTILPEPWRWYRADSGWLRLAENKRDVAGISIDRTRLLIYGGDRFDLEVSSLEEARIFAETMIATGAV